MMPPHCGSCSALITKSVCSVGAACDMDHSQIICHGSSGPMAALTAALQVHEPGLTGRCRGCCCRHSYVEGRLRLAEKERARRLSRTGGSIDAKGVAPALPPSQDLAQLEAQANANMAALLLEEASTKVRLCPRVPSRACMRLE